MLRWWSPLLLLCASVAAHAATSAAAEEPPTQTQVFYNARIALREDRPNDVLKLWLLRNAVNQRGEGGEHDADFRSVVWAALGTQGFCEDGFAGDEEEGAGLWTLALHNYLVKNLSKGPPPDQASPWDSFEVGRQQRKVSLQDVLSAEELRSTKFFRTNCLLPRRTLLQLNLAPWGDLDDRLTVGMMMSELLERSRKLLVKQKVESLAAVEARIFDLDLALADMQAKRAKREARETAQQAKVLGMSAQAVAEMRSGKVKWPAASKQAIFLLRSLSWKPSEWLSLSRARRLSLFTQARPLAVDLPARDRLMLGLIDALINRGDGEELTLWIGFLDAGQNEPLRSAVTDGERGQRLLQMPPESGFHERAVVALHRGVTFLEEGDLQQALRSFAFALQHAEESKDAEAVRGLSRRWLSYVLSRFETSTEVIATLKALVPKQEYNQVIEDLVWRAALRADRGSFQRVTESANHGGAFDAKVDRLRPLAEGDAGRFANGLHDSMKEETHAVLAFVKLLLQNIETEDGDVRLRHVPTLKGVQKVLQPLAAEEKGSQAKQASALYDRAQAILDGLSQFDESEQGRAKAMSPNREAYAGSIRLAPSDALPWPFAMPEVQPPSVFTQLNLTPVEWRDEQGELVFGWRISE